MKIISILISAFLLTALPQWKTDFNDAKTEATKTHKLILLNFSGSDWCSPCIQMKNTIFDTKSFTDYADENLVLVKADFPRRKKNRLSPLQKKMNEAIAEKYNPDGIFPYTLLLTATGRVLKQWDGLPDVSDKQFTEAIKKIADGNR